MLQKSLYTASSSKQYFFVKASENDVMTKEEQRGKEKKELVILYIFRQFGPKLF